MTDTVLGLVVLLAASLVLGWAGSLLLGVHRRTWRVLVSGLVGLVVGFGVAAAAFRNIDARQDGTTFSLSVVGLCVLASMFASVLLDLLVRPRPRAVRHRAGLLHPVARLRARLAVYGRVRQIVGFARRRGLASPHGLSASALDSPELAADVRLFLEDCGGMFVKVGQIASTRSDLLPEPLIAELGDLQSAVRPAPADEVHELLVAELGRPVEEVFARFDAEPLAAASIGQTHRATLLDGRSVVVKVQRPGIEEVVARDAAVLRWLAATAERRVEVARKAGLAAIVEELIAGLEAELDYEREAAAAALLRRNQQAGGGLAIPEVHRRLSTRRVLVMEEVAGESIAAPGVLDRSPVPRAELADRLLTSFLHQVLDDGAYHADPHPGNVLLDEAGTLWLIDFGAVGYLDPVLLDSLQVMMIGLTTQDPSLLARAVLRLAGSRQVTDRQALEAELSVLLAEQHRGAGLDPGTLREVIAVMRRHALVPPVALTALTRALVTLDGTLHLIQPDLALGTRAMEIAAAGHGAPTAIAEDQVQQELLRALPSLRTLPGHAEDLATLLETGQLTLQLRRFGPDDRPAIDRWVDRVVFAGVGCVGLLSSAVLLLAAGTGDSAAAVSVRVLGYFGLVVSSGMLMRSVAQLLRRDVAPLGSG